MARKISFDIPAEQPADQATGQMGQGQAAPRPLASRPLMGTLQTVKAIGALGAISRSLEDISDRAKRAQDIEEKLTQGQAIVELQVDSIDGAQIADRMELDEAAFAQFRETIRAHGQNTPILVRPHPDQSGRYQVAYGHRRLKACRDIGVPVRAVVRSLSDEEMVIAQGQENSARTDLSYIERARFAARLEDKGYSRDIIMAALNVDKTVLSKLVSVTVRIPLPLIDAIGPAPSFGRTRWSELADMIATPEGQARALAAIADKDFAALESDKRFLRVLELARIKTERAKPDAWISKDGTRGADVRASGSKLSLVFDNRTAPEFGNFVRAKLQELYDEYKLTNNTSGHTP
jgi:ParB family transcriptional regulator, chromosome partitioning protein